MKFENIWSKWDDYLRSKYSVVYLKSALLAYFLTSYSKKYILRCYTLFGSVTLFCWYLLQNQKEEYCARRPTQGKVCRWENSWVFSTGWSICSKKCQYDDLLWFLILYSVIRNRHIISVRYIGYDDVILIFYIYHLQIWKNLPA